MRCRSGGESAAMRTHDGDSPRDTIGARPFARPRVLVVHGDAPMLGLAARLLEKEFTVAGLVLDAESAVERWRAARPHVIVLDVAVGSGGFETAARLRAAGCGEPLVFLSAHEGPDVVRAAWDAGGLGFVVRRDVTWDLIPAVQEALRGRRYVSTAAQPR